MEKYVEISVNMYFFKIGMETLIGYGSLRKLLDKIWKALYFGVLQLKIAEYVYFQANSSAFIKAIWNQLSGSGSVKSALKYAAWRRVLGFECS